MLIVPKNAVMKLVLEIVWRDFESQINSRRLPIANELGRFFSSSEADLV
jgi:hypothetical protein